MTTGTGGATMGAGGAMTTGAGGATGLGGAGGMTTTPCPTCAIKIQYDCTSGASIMNQASFSLELVNQTGTPVALGQVKMRYWLNVPFPTDQMVTCLGAQLGCDAVALRAVAVSPARARANAYAEISFTSQVGTLGGFANSGAIEVSISDAQSAPNDQTDDYSFDCSMPGKYFDAPKITAYIAGVLVWGTEP
jgi:hypothetical protein